MWPISRSKKNFSTDVVLICPNRTWGTPSESKVLSALKKYGMVYSGSDIARSTEGRMDPFMDEEYFLVFLNSGVKLAEFVDSLTQRLQETWIISHHEPGGFEYIQESDVWKPVKGLAWCPKCERIRKFLPYTSYSDSSRGHVCKPCGTRYLEDDDALPIKPKYVFNSINEVRDYVQQVRKQERKQEQRIARAA